MNTHAKSKKQLVHICGDGHDPVSGQNRGMTATMDLTSQALGHPRVFYKDRASGMWKVITCDVYALPGQPMYIHLICPFSTEQHTHALRVTQDAKKFTYEPNQKPPLPSGWTADQAADLFPGGLGGLLNISDAIKCTWESDPELRRGFGLATCPWNVVIDNNVARDV